MFAAAKRLGPVAEWLGRALQKLPQRFESARDLKKKIIRNDNLFLFKTG
jgi:hypothetical protein